MMRTFLIEIRDRATFIPAVATYLEPRSEEERYLLGRAGFYEGRHVLLARLEDGSGRVDPYDWGDRTMQAAHLYLVRGSPARGAPAPNIVSGDVVDVEWVLGETSRPKLTERLGG